MRSALSWGRGLGLGRSVWAAAVTLAKIRCPVQAPDQSRPVKAGQDQMMGTSLSFVLLASIKGRV